MYYLIFAINKSVRLMKRFLSIARKFYLQIILLKVPQSNITINSWLLIYISNASSQQAPCCHSLKVNSLSVPRRSLTPIHTIRGHISRLSKPQRANTKGVLHSECTWGCPTSKGTLFRTSGLAMGMLFAMLVQPRYSQGYHNWKYWSRERLWK